MPNTFFVKHGPATVLWSIVDREEIPETMRKFVYYEPDGSLSLVSQLFIGSLGQKKRFSDTENLDILDYISFPQKPHLQLAL
jgi:hypothetical protein